MIRYTVIWTPAARGQLADLWTQAADRTAVALASDRIDRTLADDPGTKGGPFFGNRALVVPPLRATFRVIPDDMMAEVFDVEFVGP